jgi:peptide chain release factor subunit 1
MVGGPSPTKEEFLKGEYLHYELMKKIIGAWDVSYTDEAGLPELVEKAQDKIEELELIKEKRAMDRFMRELRSEKNLATYGEKSVRENLELGSVDILLVSEDLHLVKAKISCQKCGYERYETVRKKNPLCKKCSSPLQVSDEKDVVLELAEIAEESGAKTEFISTDFEEGAQLLNAFGGIAAILRYTTSV